MASRYLYHLRDIALGMLVAWRHIPGHLKCLWLALCEAVAAMAWLAFLACAPLLLPLAVLLAAYAAWHEARTAKRRARFRAQVIERRTEIDRMVFGDSDVEKPLGP